MADEIDLQLLRRGERDLTSADFRGADLSGLDLSGRDFSGAKLEKCNANGANFAGCSFKGATITSAKFRGCNFSKAKLSGVMAVNVDFSESNLTGVDFRGSHMAKSNFSKAIMNDGLFDSCIFNADMNFEGATINDRTNFEGVTLLRGTARFEIFNRYDFVKGKLVRKRFPEAVVAVESDPPTVHEDNHSTVLESQSSIGPTVIVHPSGDISARLAESPTALADMARSLSRLALEEIANLQSSRPNNPDALAGFERYTDFLQSMSEGLGKLAEAIEIESQDHSGDAKYLNAQAIIRGLRETMDGWCRENAQVVSNVGRIGLIGVSTYFLTLCGAPATFAFVPAVLFGGDKVADYVKSALGKSEK